MTTFETQWTHRPARHRPTPLDRHAVLPVLQPMVDFVPEDKARREETQSYRALLGVLRRPVAQPRIGQASPAVLVPGFVAGDVSMAILSRHLRRRRRRTFRSEVGANLGCTEAMVERVLARVEAVAQAEGRPVALVGHSRGGMIVKLVGQRRPDLVAGVVVLSAPVTGTLAVAPHVRRELEHLVALNRRGLRHVLSADCVTGACAARIAAELERPLPAGIPYTSVYSPRDAIIDWRTCLDPAAELVEVQAAHTGMLTDPTVLAVVADRLAQLDTPAPHNRAEVQPSTTY